MFRPAKANAYTPINRGDVLFPTSGETIEEIGKSAVNLMDTRVLCGGDLIIFRPTIPIDPKFAGYALDCPAAQTQKSLMGRGITIMHIYSSQLKYLWLPLPPLAEQAAIVRYLDAADGRIRAYVGAKERLIALLEEERQAVIHRAVTRGLDPNAPLKPSGVEWLGDVPAHWEVVQLGRIGSFSKGSGGTKDDEVPSGIPCIRYGDLYTTHKYHINRSRSFIPEEKLDKYTPIQYGDILFPTSGETIEEIGRSAVNLMEAPVYCGGDLIIFRPTVPMAPKFSGYMLDFPNSQDQKSRMGRGVSIMHIYASQLKYLWLCLPPIEEQQAIAVYLDKATADIDAAIARARRQVELMQEYRARLIADVVTGKIDVRGCLVGKEIEERYNGILKAVIIGTPWLTVSLVTLMCILEYLSVTRGLRDAWNDQYGFIPDKAITYLTHAFLHTDEHHLAKNMLVFLITGYLAERRLGRTLLVVVVLFVAVTAVWTETHIVPKGEWVTERNPVGFSHVVNTTTVIAVYYGVSSGITWTIGKIGTRTIRFWRLNKTVSLEKFKNQALNIGIIFAASWLIWTIVDEWETENGPVAHVVGAIIGFIIVLVARIASKKKNADKRAERYHLLICGKEASRPSSPTRGTEPCPWGSPQARLTS